MTSSDWFRSQATRLFEMADQAKENGNLAMAAGLTSAAARYLEQAVALETAEALRTPTNDGQPPPKIQPEAKE